jgi:galactofuranosylgalactofuranosylrhamnosyl-N-acetylglucosaminyl-diphospho-decaprenol beta-1,5/1,6-galactofuranosyltransferase
MNDGTAAALYRRDPQQYRELLKRTLELHARFAKDWPQLAQRYRAALADITSPETWEQTFSPWKESGDE